MKRLWRYLTGRQCLSDCSEAHTFGTGCLLRQGREWP